MHDLIITNGTVVDGTGAKPRVADIAVTDGVITEIGTVDGSARRRVDADGLVVAPGWVDIHTHYDGQVTWDPEVSPSSWHGATTIVMGNCGVGFAPRRPGGEQFLIELMEGVEDIPGSALNEGIDWQWESFPEYLDAVDSMPRVLDVAAQVPHCALRAYVMGDRAHDEPSADEIGQMARLTEEALRAGAVGFSTSRTILHRSKHGLIPGTAAMPDELIAIGEVIGRVGRRVVELVGDDVVGIEERGWMRALAGVEPPSRSPWPRVEDRTTDIAKCSKTPLRRRHRGCRSSHRLPTDRPACSSASSHRFIPSSPIRRTRRSRTFRSTLVSPSCGAPKSGRHCSPRRRPRRTASVSR